MQIESLLWKTQNISHCISTSLMFYYSSCRTNKTGNTTMPGNQVLNATLYIENTSWFKILQTFKHRLYFEVIHFNCSMSNKNKPASHNWLVKKSVILRKRPSNLYWLTRCSFASFWCDLTVLIYYCISQSFFINFK